MKSENIFQESSLRFLTVIMYGLPIYNQMGFIIIVSNREKMSCRQHFALPLSQTEKFVLLSMQIVKQNLNPLVSLVYGPILQESIQTVATLLIKQEGMLKIFLLCSALVLILFLLQEISLKQVANSVTGMSFGNIIVILNLLAVSQVIFRFYPHLEIMNIITENPMGIVRWDQK